MNFHLHARPLWGGSPVRSATLFICLTVLMSGSGCAAAQSIEVTNPHAKTTWFKTNSYPISWIATDVKQPRVTVSLTLGGKEVAQIAGPTPTTQAGSPGNSVNWTVPDTLADGMYQVRVQTTNGRVSDLSDPFPIKTLWLEVEPGSMNYLNLAKIMEDRCNSHVGMVSFAQATNARYSCGFEGGTWDADGAAEHAWCMGHIYLHPEQVRARSDALWKQLQECLGLYEYTVKLTDIDVHDDCDNVSAGDWYVALESEATPSANLPGDFAVWPGTDESRNVDSGHDYPVGIDNHGVIKGFAKLRVGVSVLDCDASAGAWFWPIVGVPIPPITSEIAAYETGRYQVNCSHQEEIWEYSGGNDFLDYTWKEFSPEQWKKGVTFTIDGDDKAAKACGSDGAPFTAHLELSAKRKP